MKHIITLIAVAVSFTFGACCTSQDQCKNKPADKCCDKHAHAAKDSCCAKKKK